MAFNDWARGAWRLTPACSNPGAALRPHGRHVSVALLVLLLLLAFAQQALAATYPEEGRVVKIVVPSGAGSAIDLLARAYGRALEESANINSIVENRPGAEGVPGVASALSAVADGYTMLIVSSSMVALNPVLLPKLSYDPLKDLEPLTTLSQAGLVMSLGSSTNFKTAREFVEAARSNPGKYTCATTTTNTRMACDYFQARAGVKLLNVPYKTAAAGALGLASGEVDAMILDASSFETYWQTGRVRPIGVATENRLPGLPKVPTMSEEGVPDFHMRAWYAAYFKKGTPPERVVAMREALRKAADTDIVKRAQQHFVHEPLHLSGEEITALNRREIEKWKKLVLDYRINSSN